MEGTGDPSCCLRSRRTLWPVGSLGGTEWASASSPRTPDACPCAPSDHRTVTAVNTPQRGRQRVEVCSRVS